MAQDFIRVNDTLTNILESNTGDWVTYAKETVKPTGGAIDDTFVAIAKPLYRKLVTEEHGVEYFKLIYTTLNLKWFGITNKDQYKYDVDYSDSTTADDGVYNLVTSTGLRLKRITKSNPLIIANITDFLLVNSYNSDSVYLNNTTVGGLFKYFVSGYLVDNYNVFSAKGGGVWVREQTFDSITTFSNSKRYIFESPYKNVVLTKISGVYYVYRKSGMDSWEQIQMNEVGVGSPFRVGSMYIIKPKAYAVPYIASDVTLVGSWAKQVSGGPDLYVGGNEAFSAALNDTATTTFTPASVGAQVGIVLRFANNSGMCKVTINGGTSLINLLPKDVNGDVIIDTYNATQIAKNHIPLASSLPNTPITIQVTVLNTKNPASIATRVNLNAFYAISDGISDPLDRQTKAPVWTPSTLVLTNEHRSYLGNEYSAVGGGTTGTNPPVHTTGTVSDGSVSWLWIRNSYASDEQLVRQDTSESEYAGILKNPTTGVEGEWGDDIHGNEIRNSMSIYLDGAIQILNDGDIVKGTEVKIKQNITALDDTDGNTPAFDINMQHFFRQEGAYFDYVQTALKNVLVTGFFQYMHTIYHYDNLGRRILFDKVTTPKRGSYLIANSYGDASVQFGREKSIEMMASGTAFKTKGVAGSVTKTGGTDNIFFTLFTEAGNMNLFKDSPAGAYIQVNPSGKTEPDGNTPNSAIFTKLYYSSIRDKEILITTGQTITGGGGWNTSLFKNV